MNLAFQPLPENIGVVWTAAVHGGFRIFGPLWRFPLFIESSGAVFCVKTFLVFMTSASFYRIQFR
jgi:hypothetical protein